MIDTSALPELSINPAHDPALAEIKGEMEEVKGEIEALFDDAKVHIHPFCLSLSLRVIFSAFVCLSAPLLPLNTSPHQTNHTQDGWASRLGIDLRLEADKTTGGQGQCVCVWSECMSLCVCVHMHVYVCFRTRSTSTYHPFSTHTRTHTPIHCDKTGAGAGGHVFRATRQQDDKKLRSCKDVRCVLL